MEFGLNKMLYFFDVFEIFEKKSKVKYVAKETGNLVYDLTRNEIISLSQVLNVLSQAAHPSIEKFFGYNPINFIKRPAPVIITEFLSNYSLEKMLEQKRKGNNSTLIDDTNKLIITYGIAAGMSFLHSNNILHRDLKPSNILLDCNLYPKISGFSLSKQITDNIDQIRSELIGTPAYLAPEVLLAKKYNKKSDVYAFSLILYEIITENKPFPKNQDILELFEKVKSQKTRPKFNVEIQQCYQNLIEKCWSQDPDERPTFDEILSTLKNDSSFITDKVNRKEFFNYIKFIESSKSSFNKSKKIRHLDHIINTQLSFFSKEIRSTFIGLYSTHINPVKLNGFSFDFSNYEKHEKIGEGSFGKVFKIINKESSLIYAAKESIREINSFSNKNIDYHIREVLILTELEFPSIIKFIGFNFRNIKNKPKPTFIFEYASNGTLLNILELIRKGEKVKEWNDTKKLITIFGIASAINYLHSKHVIHKDIKPSNILFDDFLFPKLSDFGLSELTSNYFDDDSTIDDLNNISGTPEYLAPELLDQNCHRYSELVDIYSFGIIMYEIMTGERPFKNLKNPVDVVNEVIQNHGRPKFDNKIPDCYKSLIEKCWSENPDDRPLANEIVELLKTNQDFITDNVNEKEYINYIKYIESSNVKADYNHLTNMPIFKNQKINDICFQKVDIYLNRPKKIELRNISINIRPIELNKYEILKIVGEGSFGTVYKVCDKITNELYAAKVSIYEIDQCNDDIAMNFEREVNIISKLNHPSIMKFIGFNLLNFKYKRKPTIITEFLSNGTLDKVIELERMNIGLLDWDDTKKLINIYGIASGMKYLHSLNILHRDLKPSNILLDEYLFPKLSDFGLSKQIFENQTQDNSGFKGTPAYTAPEVFDGIYSKAGDVYSFAFIVYEIITNEIIFPKINQYQLMIQVRKGLRPSFNYPIQNCYQKLINDCWNEDPNKRPTFDEIIYRLKNNSQFITENINKEEFLNYISLLDEDKTHNNSFPTISLNTKKIQNIDSEEYFTSNNFLDLNKYEKVSLISKGDFDKIYKIKNKETSEVYQGKISIMNMNKISRDELINLSREVNILSKINHPSFMKFIGYSPIDFKNRQKPIIFTEFPLNNSLEKILEMEKNLESIPGWNDTKKLINIFGIASAMSYLHSHDIIHRDLKPCNIFLDDYLFPKIGDFGLSKRICCIDSISYQTTSGLKGSPIYSSPEILQYNDYSKSGDVYSFSYIVFEILTHEIPFRHINNINEIYIEIVIKNNRPKIPDFIPNCYRLLIEKCWSKDVNERPSFSEIVEKLKTDSSFITAEIRKEEYFKYIEFIEKAQISLNWSNEIIQIDDFHSKIKIEEKNCNYKINEDDEIQSQEKLIKNYIMTKNTKKLIEYLKENNDEGFISSFFDRCYIKDPEFHFNLCKEGINVINNGVIQYHYAKSLIFKRKDIVNSTTNDLQLNEARSYLEKSIRQGYTKSYFLLSILLHEFYHEDEYVLKIAKEGSKKGDKYSQCLTGYLIAKGIGTKKDHQKGIKMMLESGLSDYYERFSTDIGIYYINLIGSYKNKEDKLLFHNESEKLSESTVSKYKEKAFHYFKKAFKLKKTKATINNYGICYMKGIGVQKSIEKAKEIFKCGELIGDSNSKYHLGFILEETNQEESYNYYKEAAYEGHIESQYHNASICKDRDESAKFFKLAADKGHSNSQASFALMMSQKDPDLAHKYFMKSSKKYNLKSIEFLAMKFSKENDIENTFKYMSMLIKLGDYDIPINYSIQLYKNKHFKQAFYYFSIIFKNNHPIAQYFVALMKFYGQGCQKNIEESFLIMKDLSLKGVERAKEFIENKISITIYILLYFSIMNS